MIGNTLAGLVGGVVLIFSLLIFIRVILSFLPQFDRGHPLVEILDQLTAPVIRPFQRLLPGGAGIDFSPVLAIFTLQFTGGVLATLLRSLPV